MGGEKKLETRPCQETWGSPPRGRGKAIAVSLFLRFGRITPAWAGKSPPTISHHQTRKDHPRVGGEKLVVGVGRGAVLGSPPRGRGKADPRKHRTRQAGITPAWAGKSDSFSEGLGVSQDHPRVGGEKFVLQARLLSSRGITPAWAGKRLKRSHRSGIFISGPIPFHSVLHRPAGSGGSRAGRDGSPAGQPQNTGPA